MPLHPLLKKYEEKCNKQTKDVVVKIKRKITDCRLYSTKSDDGNNNNSSSRSNNNNNNNISNNKHTKQHISQKQIKNYKKAFHQRRQKELQKTSTVE